MPKESAPEKAKVRFGRLAEEIAAGDGPGAGHREGFGTGSLFVGRKMFAVLDASGDLVVKLPPERVQELIARKIGRGWSPGAMAPLKEYLAIPLARQNDWLAYAREARTYMAGRK